MSRCCSAVQLLHLSLSISALHLQEEGVRLNITQRREVSQQRGVEVSPENFLNTHVSQKLPIHLMEAISHAPALSLWNEEYLKGKLHTTETEIFSQNSTEFFKLKKNFQKELPKDLEIDAKLPFCLQCAHHRFQDMKVLLDFRKKAPKGPSDYDVSLKQENLLCIIKADKRTATTFEISSLDQGPSFTDENLQTQSFHPKNFHEGDCLYVPRGHHYFLSGAMLILLFQWTSFENKTAESKTCRSVFDRNLDLRSWMSSPVEEWNLQKSDRLCVAFWKSLRRSALFERKSVTHSVFPFNVDTFLEKWYQLTFQQPQLGMTDTKQLLKRFSKLVKDFLDEDHNNRITENEYAKVMDERNTSGNLLRQEDLIVEFLSMLRSRGVEFAELLRPKVKKEIKKPSSTSKTVKKAKKVVKRKVVPIDVSSEDNLRHHLPLPDNDLDKMKHYCQEFIVAMHRIKVLHEGLFPVDIDEEFSTLWEKATMPNPFLRALFQVKPDIGDFLHVKMKKLFQHLFDMDKDAIVSREEFKNALSGKFTDNIDFASQLVVIHNFVDTLKHESELDLIRYIKKHQPVIHDEL